MATMEISIEQYNALLDKINTLEQDNVNLRKQVSKYQDKIYNANQSIEIFRGANWYDRVFGWKQILSITNHNM